MAFKRSAVRSRLSPPSPRDCERKPHFFGSGVFALCSDGNDVHAHAELLKVNVKVDMQLVVPVDLHPRSEEHTSELQSRFDIVCRLLLEKKNSNILIFCNA